MDSNLPVTVGVPKIEASYRGIRNIVIRHIITNIVPAIVAEVQCFQDRVELHSNHIPDACRCSPMIEVQLSQAGLGCATRKTGRDAAGAHTACQVPKRRGCGKHTDRLHATQPAVATAEHGCRAGSITSILLLSLSLDSRASAEKGSNERSGHITHLWQKWSGLCRWVSSWQWWQMSNCLHPQLEVCQC